MIKKGNNGYKEIMKIFPYVYGSMMVMDLSLYYACHLYFDSKKYNVETIYKYLNKKLKSKSEDTLIMKEKIFTNIEYLRKNYVTEEIKKKTKTYYETVKRIDTDLYDSLKSDKPLGEVDQGYGVKLNKKQLLGQFKRSKKIGALHGYAYFKRIVNEKDCAYMIIPHLNALNEVTKEIEAVIKTHQFKKEIDNLFL